MLFNEYDINKSNNNDYNHYSKEPLNTEDVMTVPEWIGVLIVLAMPILNLIMYIMWAFGRRTNENLKNFCRATLIIGTIGILLSIMLGGCMAFGN